MSFLESDLSPFGQWSPPCCFCGKPLEFIGHNAAPVLNGRCCDFCNTNVVIPWRLAMTSLRSHVYIIRNAAKQMVGVFSNAVNAIEVLRAGIACFCTKKDPLCIRCSTNHLTCEKLKMDAPIDETETDVE